MEFIDFEVALSRYIENIYPRVVRERRLQLCVVDQLLGSGLGRLGSVALHTTLDLVLLIGLFELVSRIR